MERLGLGDEAYLRVLCAFLDTYEAGFITPPDPSGAAALLAATQSLRDASGVIGAYEIAELASAVGVECAADPDLAVLSEMAAQVQVALAELVQHLRGRLPG